MTVAELIVKLQSANQNADVLVHDFDDSLKGSFNLQYVDICEKQVLLTAFGATIRDMG